MFQEGKNWSNFATDFVATWIKVALLQRDENHLKMSILAVSKSDGNFEESAKNILLREVENWLKDEKNDIHPDQESTHLNQIALFLNSSDVNWKEIIDDFVPAEK